MRLVYTIFVFVLISLFLGFIVYLFYFWFEEQHTPPPKNKDVFPPTQPKEGPGGGNYLTSKIRILEVDDKAGRVWIFIPQEIPLQHLPVVLFLHGWDGFRADSPKEKNAYHFHYSFIEHIVRKGYILIYPLYQRHGFRHYVRDALLLYEDALRELKNKLGKTDFSKISIIGYSIGSSVGARLILSGKISFVSSFILVEPADGFPLVPRFIFGLPFPDFNKIPSQTHLLFIFGESDRLVSHRQIKKLFSQASTDYKQIFEIRSDNWGNPPLFAGHVAFLADPSSPSSISAMDYFGYWKIITANLNCVFFKKDCKIARGETPDSFYMGRWSDGRAIKPILKLLP